MTLAAANSMGGVNSIPVVSQAKSGVQLICGDTDGAAETQKDFFQQCPVVSQVTSTVQLITGDVDGALETQIKCGNALLRTADGIPVVGHVKGAIHYACGDTDGGNKAIMSATRTSATMGAGAAGFLVGGPVGAVAAGVAGGAAFDTTVTVVDSVANDEYRPSGYYAAVGNIVKNPNPGDIFDTCFIPVGDGLAGYSGGRIANQFAGSSSSSAGASGGQPPTPGAAELAKVTALEAQAEAILEAAETGKMNMPSGEYLRMANEAKAIWQQAQDLKGVPAAQLAEASILEAKADSLTDAALDRRMDMKDAQYVEMNKQAQIMWEKAQELKGLRAPKVPTMDTKVPTMDTKVPPLQTPQPPAEVYVGAVDVLPQSDQDRTQSESITVVETWVLWITDEVFVTGTNKAIVELITAFLVKDIPLVEQICQELNIDPKTIFGEYASYTYAKISELALRTGSLFGMTQEKLVEIIEKGGKKGRQAVRQFFSDLYKQKEKTKKKDERSQRGEHVINNGVINVYRDIIGLFLVRSGITRDGLGALTMLSSEESQILRDCTSYFDTRTKTDIQDVLKVFIDEDTAYIDANALLYGTSIQLLRESALAHMLELYYKPTLSINDGSSQTRPLKEIIRTMNDSLLYVDQHALSIWLTRKGLNGRRTYERAQLVVENMFNDLYDKSIQWVREFKRQGY